MSSAHCFSEGKEECKLYLRISSPGQLLAEGPEPQRAHPAFLGHPQCSGLGPSHRVLCLYPSQTLPLQQGWLRVGIGVLDSALEYQEEILLALFSLNLCLLDSGQCPKVCAVCGVLPAECSLSLSREYLLSLLHLSALEPVGNAFYFIPWHSGGFQQP